MATYTTFQDETDINIEMKFYINVKERPYIQIGDKYNDYEFRFITLVIKNLIK